MRGIICRELTVQRLTAAGETLTVLDGISTHFPRSKIVVIHGETGAGKSTLLYVLAGMERPWAGEVIVDDEPVSRWLTPRKDIWRRKTGVVLQQPFVLSELTVLENVMIPLIPICSDMDDVNARAIEMLDRAVLAHKAAEQASVLSGGELQRLAIARALISEPDFLFADEPTSHQDDSHFQIVLDLLRSPIQRNGAVIVTTHDNRLRSTEFADLSFKMTTGKLIGV